MRFRLRLAGLGISMGLVFVIALAAPGFVVPARALQSNAIYAASNAGITNVQASHPVTGGATDQFGNPVLDARYKNDFSESWIAINPTQPGNLIGMSKFFFVPTYYLFHVGSYASFDGGNTWTNEIVPGFDPLTASSPSNVYVDTTDPVVAFDRAGNAYSAMLPFSFSYNPAGHQVWNVVPNDAIFVVKSADGGRSWTTGNGGQPLAVFNSGGLGVTADKQWIAVDKNSPTADPHSGNVYVGWSVFKGSSVEVFVSVSANAGKSFSAPNQISFPQIQQPFNTYVFLGVGPDGTVYAVYTAFPSSASPVATIYLAKSLDGGMTWSFPTKALSFTAFPSARLPNTTFRDGIADSFAVSPSSGHLFLALEAYNGVDLDVQLAESSNGGATWTAPLRVNDNRPTDGTDQFQPTVAVSPSGVVAVAFYDRRLACPTSDPNILPADQGRTNFCIDTSIQFYDDEAGGLQAIGSNIRLSQATWDPQDPGSAGLPHPGGPNGGTTFIGDYFGLTLTQGTAYALFVSTYNFGQNPSNNQQQFLAKVSVP